MMRSFLFPVKSLWLAGVNICLMPCSICPRSWYCFLFFQFYFIIILIILILIFFVLFSWSSLVFYFVCVCFAFVKEKEKLFKNSWDLPKENYSKWKTHWSIIEISQTGLKCTLIKWSKSVFFSFLYWIKKKKKLETYHTIGHQIILLSITDL